MSINPTKLQELALAAYERDRLRRALGLLWLVLPLVVLSYAICGEPRTTLVIGTVLAIAAVFFDWRGREMSSGARLGLIAGMAGFALPVVFHLTGLCCQLDIETAICVASGVAAGLLVASRLRTIEASRQVSFMLVGGVVAALAGSLGCAFLGGGGVVGVAAGVFLATAPALIYVRVNA